MLGIDLIGSLGIAIKVLIGTPVGFRHFGDRINPFFDIRPERSGVGCLREKTANADNGQWCHDWNGL